MDKRATHTPTGTADAHPSVPVELRDRTQRPSIDGAGQPGTTDLSKVFRAIAARIDVVLDEKVAAGAEPESRHRAARAWSSVVGKRMGDDTSDLRRHALATTVLRISADGRLDIDDREDGVSDVVAEPETRTETEAGNRHAVDAPSETGREIAAAVPVASPDRIHVASVRDAASATSAPAAADRSDVEARLRAARERLEVRRAGSTRAHGVASDPRSGRVRLAALRRTEVRTVAQRLLIGLAIVGLSAIVSILAT